MAVRVGIIGLGIGLRHLEEYRRLQGAQVGAVADFDLEKARQVAARYGLRAYGDGVAMMDEEKLDAVSICTPPASHRLLTEAAAARGLHVLCEKPMAPTLADCDAMIAACQRAGVTLLLGFKKRSAPPFRFLKEQEKEWGPPLVLDVRYQLGPVLKGWFWDEADGGGPFVENTAHAFDMLRFLCGEPARVYAEGTSFFSPVAGAASEAACTIRFRNGAIASLAAGMAGIWGYDESERWVVSYGALNAELFGPFDVPRQLRLMRRDGQTIEERWWAEASGWPEQMAHFLACVRGQEQPRATGEDGRAALALSLAVKESIRSGKVVELA